MKVSLNELVALVSEIAGHPFSIPLQEELKVILNYKRSDYIQKIISKYPENRKYFLKYFTVELEPVPREECPYFLDCTVLRTTKKIPIPLRSGYTMFDFCGSPDKIVPFTYTTPEQLLYIINYGSKYTQDKAKYNYINGYLYIYNDDTLEYIGVGGIWPDQRELKPFKCENQPCYTDDDQYEIADDIINTMVQDVIKNELRFLMTPEKGEITVKNDKEN